MKSEIDWGLGLAALAADRPTRPDVSEDDPRVVRALEEYLAAIESGRRLDRREFLARHEAIAPALAACLDGVEMLRSAAPHFGTPASAASPPARPPSTGVKAAMRLGDYRIVREVGRGGMGVVYEAEQTSLGRRVALKVLPAAAAMDPRQRQRFQVEAQAAALLHHPSIVPVYSVGCEGEVHYYAMQFIEGRSLAALIQELRRLDGTKAPLPGPADSTVTAVPGPASRPGAVSTSSSPPLSPASTTDRAFFRQMARLGIQAAEALAHAHEQGVVHRDVKPSNLLVDDRGALWITDFGLARLQNESDLTLSGDLIGTLRYMSPEQAMAKRTVIDHRTDIYSLGATLYELLALEPVFDGRDRQELLHQVANEEPRPLRRVRRSVPRELETIVLKAMAKEPSARYATAQDLADDLRRFLDDQPILARRPTPLDLANKWARRHRAAVVTAAATLSLTLVALAAGLFLLWQQKRQTDENARVAYDAIDRFSLYIGEQDSIKDPERQEDLKKLLGESLKLYERLTQLNPSDREARWRRAMAYHKVGVIRERLYRLETRESALLMSLNEAEGAFRDGAGLLEALVRESPGDPRYREEWSHTLIHWANLLLMHPGQAAGAEPLFRKALNNYKDLVEKHPDEPSYRLGLGSAYNALSIAHQQARRWTAQEDAARVAVGIHHDLSRKHPVASIGDKARMGLADSYTNLGDAYRSMNRSRDAEQAFDRAVKVIEDLVKKSPKEPDYRAKIAMIYSRMCCPVICPPDQPQKAEHHYRRALTAWEGLATDFPKVPEYRESLAGAQSFMAYVFASLQRLPAAEKYQRGELATWERLSRDFPSVARYRGMASAARLKLVSYLCYTGRSKEALTILDGLVQADPDDANACNNLAWHLVTCPESGLWNPQRALELANKAVAKEHNSAAYWNTLGVVQVRVGNWADAKKAFEASMGLSKGGDPADWLFLAIARWHLGEPGEALRLFERADKALRSDPNPNQDFLRFRAEAARVLGIGRPVTPLVTDLPPGEPSLRTIDSGLASPK